MRGFDATNSVQRSIVVFFNPFVEFVAIKGEQQVKAYPRTQTNRRTVGKANGRRIIGAFRKTLFGTTFRFV